MRTKYYILISLGLFGAMPSALESKLSGDVKEAEAAKIDGDAILAKAREAAGGDDWANAKTLQLSGRSVFYGGVGAEPRSIADDYRMTRVFDNNRASAHGPAGKVHIVGKSGSKILFEVGYDGQVTWTEKGIVPKKQADAYWANNFGFGIIRQVGKLGFKAKRIADDLVDGHPSYMVELSDPSGSATLFGIDKQSHAIRMVGFRTPKGWHVRTYDDFVRSDNPNWLQARRVSLYYDGRKSNDVYWESFKVNEKVDPVIFSSPQK